MQTNRFEHQSKHPASRPPHAARVGQPIGDIRRPVPRQAAPPAPQPNYIPRAVASPEPQHVAHKPIASHPTTREAEQATISIKLKIPSFKRATMPLVLREHKVLWGILAVAGLLLFTIGYQLGQSKGRSAAPPAPAVTWVQPVALGRVS